MTKTTTYILKLCSEILVGLIILALVAAGILVWRLSQGPIVLDRYIPRVEEYFNNRNTERIDIVHLSLQWNAADETLQVSAQNVVVSNQRGPFIFAPKIDLTVSLLPLLVGKLELDSVWIRQIVLSVTKTKEGQIKISGQPVDDSQIPPDQGAVPALLTLNDLLYDLPAMNTFWLDQARLIYRDEAAGQTKTFDPVTLFAEIKADDDGRSLSGFFSFPFGSKADSNRVQLMFETQKDPLSLVVRGTFKETPLSDFLQFAPPLPENVAIDSTVNANLTLWLDNVWQLYAMDVDLSAKTAELSLPIEDQEYKASVSDIVIKAHHDPKNEQMVIEDVSFRLGDDNIPFRLNGDIKHLSAPNKLAGHLTLTTTDLPQAYFKRYWPVAYSDNGAYEWLTQKISSGIFPTVTLSVLFDGSIVERTDGTDLPPWLQSVKAEFTVEDADIDYHAPMASAKDVSGHGVYENVSLTLDNVSGVVGGMKTTGATLHFDDLITTGKGLGTLHFPIQAQAQQVFDYIAAEPIAAFDKVDFKPAGTSGIVDVIADVKIPLTKDAAVEDIAVDVKGTVREASVPNAVKGLTLSGGPYNIEATAEEIKVKGSGQLQGQPITLDWHEYFSPKDQADYLSKINATVTADDIIRRAFLSDIADYFGGTTQGVIAYVTDKAEKTNIHLDLDLAGTSVDYDTIGLTKATGQPAKATLDIQLKKGDLTALKDIKISGKTVAMDNGNISFTTQGGEPVVMSGRLDKAVYDGNKFSLQMAQELGILKITISGDTLNIHPFLKQDKDVIKEETEQAKSTSRPVEIGIEVAKMSVSEKFNDDALKTPKAYVRLGSQGQVERFEMDAKLGQAGQDGNFSIRYTPEVSDGLSLRVQSNNAGEFLRAFDLYPYIKGGTLQIAGRPIEGGNFGDVAGHARIDNFEAMNAPILLRLVNALSFQTFLSGGSLKFTRLESDFEWKIAEQGDIYKISEGKTSGASVALTFDGYVDTANDDMNIKGTAAPLSEINSFVSKIPLIGQILTGGGALLAATYTISGNPDDPSVGVNPLSVLTPGIVRKLLFENTPQPKQVSDDKKSATGKNP